MEVKKEEAEKEYVEVPNITRNDYKRSKKSFRRCGS